MRLIETIQRQGDSGESYNVNIYPADMRFNDFIPGVFLLLAGDDVLYVGESNNVDQWLQGNKAYDRCTEAGITQVGLIRRDNPTTRKAVFDDLIAKLSPRFSDLPGEN